MTVTLTEGRLTFHFPANADVSKYDDWSFYRNQFNHCFGGTKAIDFVYVDTSTLWLIEVKDYRAHTRIKMQDLGDEIAQKVRDTMAGLLAAQANANDAQEMAWAQKAVSRNRIHVVLHLEQPARHSRAFPQVVNPANLQLKLKQLLRPVDSHPRVVNQHTMPATLRWSVTE